jgi:hypothetical protein
MFRSLFLMIALLQPAEPFSRHLNPQAIQGKLHATVKTYSLSADNFLQALTKTASQFEIPMGIEWVREPQTMRPFNRTWKQATPYKIIRTLVNTQPGYEFEVRGSVVHVHPHGSLGDPHDFLNLNIKRFVVKDEYVASASYRLRQIVREASMPPSGSGTAASITSGAGDKPVTLDLQNVKVRKILDALSLASGLKMWVVTYPQDTTLTQTGFRRTGVAHTDATVPDSEQPAWQFWQWGPVP